MSAAKERDRLREALEKVVKCSDDGLAKCPVNNGKQKVKGDPCERCGARTNENCGLTVSADSAAIELARAALPATAAQPEGGEWTTQDLECDGPNKWRVYFGGLEYVVMSDGSAIATAKAHNASLAAAQRNEKLWRAEWEQISETARVLQEKLAAQRPDMLAALQNILNGIETGVITSDHDETLANAADNARAAIAKAKKR